MIKVEIEIKQLPYTINGRVRGQIALKSKNYDATPEEMRNLETLVNKVKEIAKDISEEHGSEVAMFEKEYVRQRKPANHR